MYIICIYMKCHTEQIKNQILSQIVNVELWLPLKNKKEDIN